MHPVRRGGGTKGEKRDSEKPKYRFISTPTNSIISVPSTFSGVLQGITGKYQRKVFRVKHWMCAPALVEGKGKVVHQSNGKPCSGDKAIPVFRDNVFSRCPTC